MKIAIIGAGRVGSTLGRGLAGAGHAVLYAVRDTAKPREGLDHPGAQVVEVRAAVEAADVVLLTTPWGQAEAAVRGAGDLTGKILVDVTNPIGPGLTLTHGHTDSGAEQVARWASGARVVKAFNTTGVENMANPRYGAQSVVMPVCGDDEAARATVLGLARDLGFEAVDAGPLKQARLLEPFALVWIDLALVRGMGRGFGFGLLRRG
jgi:predicted dinucleotide-binding enzyme